MQLCMVLEIVEKWVENGAIKFIKIQIKLHDFLIYDNLFNVKLFFFIIIILLQCDI